MRFNCNEGQQLFNVCIWLLWQCIRICFKCLIYSPFILSGWGLANLILNMRDNILLWIVFIFLFAILFFKGILYSGKWIQMFRTKRNVLWIPLWICCTGFTTIIPVWIVFQPLEKLIGTLSSGSHTLQLTWIIVLG